MTKALWIGLLRGVNVGGHTIEMKTLVKGLLAEGLEDVKTYIASGNLLFRSALSAPELEALIEGVIRKLFGFEAPVFLVTATHLKKLLDENPYRDAEAQGAGQHIFFLKAKASSADLDALSALKDNGEDFTLTDEAFYLYAPNGIGRSKLAEKIGRYIKADMTARNLNTVKKLIDMAGAMTA